MKQIAVLVWLGIGFLGLVRGDDATTNVRALPNVSDNPLGIALEDACRADNINQAALLMEDGAPVDAKIGKPGVTPLMVACERDVALVRFLISKGAKLDITDADGNTALKDACYEDKTDCALALLDAGANPNLADLKGRTPLIGAVWAADETLLKALLAHHADVNANASTCPALACAIYSFHADIMQALVDAGADVNLVPPAGDREDPALTPLETAVASGNIDAMYFLFDHHADINLLNNWKVSPLMAAAFRDQIVPVDELLDRGAKVDVQSVEGVSALRIAAYAGFYDVAEALVSNHADLELRDNQGRTPLIVAARHLHGNVVTLLLDNGANVDATDHLGETALAYAAIRGDTALVERLRAHGAARTDLHALAWPRPQPPLPVARAWALAVSALFAELSADDPNVLGYGDVPNRDLLRGLREEFKITDRASLLRVLDDLHNGQPRQDWQEEGAKLAAISDDNFKTALTFDRALGAPLDQIKAVAIRRNYMKWKDRIGLAWALCVSANLVNRGYTAHYVDETEAWSLLLPIARRLQVSFSSWQEMSDNFLDGREIWAATRKASFDNCCRILLNPKDPNSPWNQNPWKTDLAGN